MSERPPHTTRITTSFKEGGRHYLDLLCHKAESDLPLHMDYQDVSSSDLSHCGKRDATDWYEKFLNSLRPQNEGSVLTDT